MGIADDVRKLSESIVADHNARVKAIGTIVKETQTQAKNTHIMLKGFSAEHKKMSADQAKALGGFAADLTKNVGGMLQGFGSEHKDMAASLKTSLEKNTGDIEIYVKNKLREFSAARADMSAELKKDLAKYVADIVKRTRELLDALHDERGQMAAHWQAMAAVMAGKRGVETVQVEAKSGVKNVGEAVAKPPKKKPGRKPAKKG